MNLLSDWENYAQQLNLSSLPEAAVIALRFMFVAGAVSGIQAVGQALSQNFNDFSREALHQLTVLTPQTDRGAHVCPDCAAKTVVQ